MELGRKIYYDKATGNVLVDTGEMEGSVVPTTTEQDFQTYANLQGRIVDTVGIIQLEPGQDRIKFNTQYYHINPVTNLIEWGNLINPHIPVPQPTNQEIQDNLVILMASIADLYEAVTIV